MVQHAGRPAGSGTLGWAAAYVLAGGLGALTAPSDGSVPLVWPATGVAVLWLLRSERPVRDGVVLALLTPPVALSVWPPPWPVPLLLASLLGMAFLGRWSLRRVAPCLLDRPIQVYVVWRTVAAAAGVATAGTAVIALGGLVDPGEAVLLDLLPFWGRHFGAVVALVLPWALFCRASREQRVAGLRALVEGRLLLALAATIACYGLVAYPTGAPIGFLLVLVLFWVGSTSSVLAATYFSLVTSVVAVLYSFLDLGLGSAVPVAGRVAEAAVTQLFLLSSFLVAVVAAISRAERQELAVALADSSQRAERRAELLTTVLGSLEERIVVLDPEGEVVFSTPGADDEAGDLLRWAGSEAERRVLAGEDVPPHDVVVRDAQDHRRVVQVRATALRPAGEDADPYAAVVVQQDVTAERAHEDRLATFAATVAHDLRNPLSAAASWAELADNVLDEQPVAPAPAAREALRRAQLAGRRALDVVDDLLSHAQARQGELRRERVDATALVCAVVEDLGLVGVVTVERLPVVEGDRALLRHVVENLLGNAAKYAAPGTAPRIRVWGGEHEGGTVLVVDDEGPGIPAADLDRVFDQFARLHPDETTGTGLGLAICRSIVERHGGTVRAEANPSGQGARFVVSLPAAAPLS